jgi:acyl dehydratase
MAKKVLVYDELEVGQKFKPSTYTLTKETIKKYAEAVEDCNPIYLDETQARDSVFKGLIGHPTTAAIYSLNSIMTEGEMPPGGIHAKQSFEFHAPVRPGDSLTTTATVVEKYIKREKKYVVFETTTVNQKGEKIVTGKMTAIWPQ